MAEIPAISFWVRAEAYREFPEAYRRAYIAGALDMLCFASIYASPEYKARIEALIMYIGKYDVDQLGRRFDEYVISRDDVQRDGAAGTLFGALNRWNEATK